MPRTRRPPSCAARGASVDRLRAEGRKILVWSNFVRNLETMERMLARHQPAMVHGGIPSEVSTPSAARTREREIARFRRDDACGVLLANPAAMGRASAFTKSVTTRCIWSEPSTQASTSKAWTVSTDSVSRGMWKRRLLPPDRPDCRCNRLCSHRLQGAKPRHDARRSSNCHNRRFRTTKTSDNPSMSAMTPTLRLSSRTCAATAMSDDDFVWSYGGCGRDLRVGDILGRRGALASRRARLLDGATLGR